MRKVLQGLKCYLGFKALNEYVDEYATSRNYSITNIDIGSLTRSILAVLHVCCSTGSHKNDHDPSQLQVYMMSSFKPDGWAELLSLQIHGPFQNGCNMLYKWQRSFVWSGVFK